MVRCFVGVFLPDGMKAYILSLQWQLKKLDLDCKFVEEANMHISLSFLGDVVDEKLDVLKEALCGLSGCFRKFPVSTGSIKLVPSEKFVRVIVVGVRNGMLDELRSAIVDKVGGDAKPPHITICRVRTPVRQDQMEGIRSLETKKITFTIDSFDLVKSVVTRQGPIYTPILKCNLS
jgi:RNA 2',3'-cyclic 3'-phosphodiesterase